jgi:hypothetical protein
MKTKKLDFLVEMPEDFDSDKFTKDLIILVENHNGKMAGMIADYPESKFKRIIEILKDLIF